ncbi:tail fiber protein [Magnetospirillum sp. 64-120]|uniref:phage tail protein n=1 Tax=Magnetospirillum sp. 64-120 TaxID=1895778 RepID=UPI00092AF669|nr:tail fiber protein [Magnetospirillum sp. 64-120]OJX74354.1 MAG: hypothetical protein BGO92_11630 [Magnetospirillum sp. 64-120]
MSEPFIGEIRYFPYTFAPYGWFECLGQMASIQNYPALYAVIGTYYGGNGTSTFGLPNLSTSLCYDPTGTHMQGVARVGLSVGEATVTLIPNHLPPHTHAMSRKKPVDGYNNQTSSASVTSDLGGLATATGSAGSIPVFTTSPPNTILAQNTVASYGGTQPHQNCQPYLVLRPCIAWDGIYPQRP